MAKNWAITIGINQYDFLPHRCLKYAKRDAELVKDFLSIQLGFEKVYYFSDDSPDEGGRPTRPFRANLLRFLTQRFKKPFMNDGDNFWFFFSGHGMRYAGKDYLIASDTDSENIENTAISINYVTERLYQCGADNIILILDACREESTRSVEGIGNQTAELAKQTGIISIFSCHPNEVSHEIEALQQGAFTRALLEGLGVQGQCATVSQLRDYLVTRVPALNSEYSKSIQIPDVIAEPETKNHLILVPKYAEKSDTDQLKIDAYKAQVEGDLKLAEQLWIRVVAASLGTDMDAIKVLQKIALLKSQQQFTPTPSESTSQANIKTQINSPEPEKIEVELISAVGVDYTNLRDLLAAGKWKEADEETAKVMLKAANKEKQDYLIVEDINNFPCEDLRTIDQLWVKYSNGYFGFSVQKRIYQSLGGTREYDQKTWEAFVDCVGWQMNKNLLHYQDFTFSTKAKEGNLPVLWGEYGLLLMGIEGDFGYFIVRQGLFILLSRQDL